MKQAGLLVFLLVLSFIVGCITPPVQVVNTSVVSSDRWLAKEGIAYTKNATAIVIEAPNCSNCDYANYVLQQIQTDALGTDIIQIRKVDYGSSEGNLLISYYQIDKLPTLILKKNGEWDQRTLQTWSENTGTFEGDGALVLRQVYPPYYDVKTGEIKGIVKFMLIINGSDAEANATADALSNQFKFIYVKNELNASSPEAQRIMMEYNLSKVPAVLLSPDAAVYPGFKDAWLKANNTVEKDGTFVLR